MIVNFDTNNLADVYKEKFGKCLDENDFEGALGVLIKYDNEFGYPDFHLACGMLYLEIALKSVDDHYRDMAFREFMFHIRRFPKCYVAYRDLVLSVLLGQDSINFNILMFYRWIASCGNDLSRIERDVSVTNIIEPNCKKSDMHFSDLFFGEYGDIDPRPHLRQKDTANLMNFDIDKTVFESNIELSKGENCSVLQDETEDDINLDEMDPDIIREFLDEFSKSAQELDRRAESEKIMPFSNPDNADDVNDEANANLKSLLEDESDRYISLAVKAIEDNNEDLAIEYMAKVKPESRHYYHSLNMRAIYYIQRNRFAEAKFLVDTACAVKPHGAVCGTLRCVLYEEMGQTSLIPKALAKIDVKDFDTEQFLFQAFKFAMTYCNDAELQEWLARCVEEYDVLQMRFMYAVLRYNDGDYDFAVEEFRKLSQIRYFDFYINYFYEIVSVRDPNGFKLDIELIKRCIKSEISTLVDYIIKNGINDETINTHMFKCALVYFLAGDFDNSKRELIKMFSAVRQLCHDTRFADVLRDFLVSPYGQPLVKIVVLAELMALNPNEQFLYLVGSVPLMCSFADIPTSSDGVISNSSKAFVYLFTLICGVKPSLAQEKLAKQVDLLEIIFSDVKVENERDMTYFLLRRLFSANKIYTYENRLPQALGYKTREEAENAHKNIDRRIRAILKN